MSTAVRAAALGVVLGVSLGCPRVPVPLEPPRADLAGSAEAPGEAGGLVVSLELTVTNPNARALEIRAVDWQLAVAGEPVVRGRDGAEPSTLPARSQAVVRVQAHVAPGAAARLKQALAKGAPLEATGTLHCYGPQGAITSGFR